jgi:hypothetical protein
MTRTLETMTKDERSLLLYLETCAVDHTGKVDGIKMNDEDRAIAERWAQEGFIKYGRVCAADAFPCATAPEEEFLTEEDEDEGSSAPLLPRSSKLNWVQLSEEAWTLAHAERRARAERLWAKRDWRTTEEYRNEE